MKKTKTITKIFSFDSSHRLDNPDLSEEENKKVFGKCNNLPSHGHSYKLFVTVSGEEENGMIFLESLNGFHKDIQQKM